MNSDDYQRVKEIFNSAVELPPENRGAFLDERCDGALRSEVERLLAAMDDEFLEKPAAEPFSGSTVNNSSRSGQRIGHYEVIRRIGSGGMGDVYLAVDGKLGRQVAVKILPDEFTTDENRLDRFQLEARSASSLSHPNILTIFEIGEWEGTHYIATEYVDGETLRQRLGRESLSIGESMDLGIQLVSAIAAAHEASICHRDIKPENIMIRRDGLLKVVDFGLAKLVASPFRASSSPTANDEPTVKIVNTEPGVIMGTVQYMSPEQTRGLSTDERSDIWSLGCVLYEMLTGHAPFKGDTSADMVAEIVKTHPELPSRLASDVPERLDEIISKSLEKNPDERYQTAKDLLIDLKRLKRNLELEDTLERSNPSMRTEPVTAITSGPNIISTRKGPKDLTEVNSAQYLYWGIKAHRWTTIGITLFVIGLVGGTSLLVREYWRKGDVVGPTVIRNPTIDRLTADAKTQFAAISPDGRFLAYVRSHGGQFSLWVKQIATNSNVEIVAPGVVKEYHYPTFSPEGDFVYFTGVNENTTTMSSIFRVPALGGPLIEVLHHAGWPSFSPDGKEIVFHTEELMPDGKREWILEVIGVDGKNRRRLTSTIGGRVLWKPAWSPDGKVIACAISDSVDQQVSVALIEPISGNISNFLRGEWSQVVDITWRPDMKAIYLEGAAKSEAADTMQLWEVALPSGSARQISQGIGHYAGVSVTADGERLVSVLNEPRTSIWVAKDTYLQGATQITSNTRSKGGLAWTKDKRIIFSSADSGSLELWSVGLDGSDLKQLTNDNDRYNGKHDPRVSADGRYIYYDNGNYSQQVTIWRVELDGTKPTKLTNGPFDAIVDLTPDSRWLVFGSNSHGNIEIKRIPIDGGEETPFDLGGLDYAQFSPDGKHLAGIIRDDLIRKLRIGIVTVEGKELVQKFDISEPLLSNMVKWTRDGKFLTYVDRTGNLWKQHINGGKTTKVTAYKEHGIQSWDWSPDGKQIAFIRGEDVGDAVTITGF